MSSTPSFRRMSATARKSSHTRANARVTGWCSMTDDVDTKKKLENIRRRVWYARWANLASILQDGLQLNPDRFIKIVYTLGQVYDMMNRAHGFGSATNAYYARETLNLVTRERYDLVYEAGCVHPSPRPADKETQEVYQGKRERMRTAIMEAKDQIRLAAEHGMNTVDCGRVLTEAIACSYQLEYAKALTLALKARTMAKMLEVADARTG